LAQKNLLKESTEPPNPASAGGGVDETQSAGINGTQSAGAVEVEGLDGEPLPLEADIDGVPCSIDGPGNAKDSL
jgi:hypothetical protein